MRRRRAAVAVALALIAAACSSGGDDGADLGTVDGFVEWLAANEASVSLTVRAGPALDVALSHRGDEPRPLASVRKVLLLGAYATAVDAGALDPDERVPLAGIERWWIPGTDGGAHDEAVAEANAAGWLSGGSLALDRVVWGMVRQSDNAAADYLLDRLGPDAVTAFAHAHGVQSTGVLTSGFGQVLSWAGRDAEGVTGPVRDLDLPDIERQRELAGSTTAGTTGEWARLMADVATGSGPVMDLMRRHLEWPLTAFPANAARFDAFGTKGGSLAGVLTEASYIQPRGRDVTVVALFLADVELDHWRSLAASFVNQQLMVAIAEDPTVIDDLRAALG